MIFDNKVNIINFNAILLFFSINLLIYLKKKMKILNMKKACLQNTNKILFPYLEMTKGKRKCY